MENGRDKASAAKVTAVMVKRSAGSGGTSAPAHPRTRSSIPNDYPVLLLSNDSAIRERRGQPRLYRKIWDEERRQFLGTDPRRTPQAARIEDSAWHSAPAGRHAVPPCGQRLSPRRVLLD